jgi:hypothetical protein
VTDEERVVIRAAAEEESTLRVPANLGVLGGVLFLASLGLFALVPRLALWWPVFGAGAVRVVSFILVAVGLFSGLALFFLFGAGRGERYVRERASAALELLATRFDALPAAERLRAAVRLVCNTSYTGGPRWRHTIDATSARTALGDALPLVEAVEAFLVAERRARPFLTIPPP